MKVATELPQCATVRADGRFILPRGCKLVTGTVTDWAIVVEDGDRLSPEEAGRIRTLWESLRD